MDYLISVFVFLFFVFIIGLCIGSFLNVVVLRAFSNESIAYPASKCPKCNTPLKWYHNIPVLSYLFLRGKCGFCRDKISIQYPIVELITGLLFVATFLKFGPSINMFFMLVIVGLFVVLATTDILEQVVFDFHTYILVGVGLVYNFFNFGHFYSGAKIFHIAGAAVSINNSFIASVLGILLGVIVMEAFARFGYLTPAKSRAFGEGDSFIAAGLGAVFGWKYLLSILLFGFLVQVTLTIPVFLKKLVEQKDFVTLVSFLAFFFVVGLFKGLGAFGLLQNDALAIILTVLLAVLGIYSCKRILSGLRSEEGRTLLPFGPAMVVGALILMFIS